MQTGKPRLSVSVAPTGRATGDGSHPGCAGYISGPVTGRGPRAQGATVRGHAGRQPRRKPDRSAGRRPCPVSGHRCRCPAPPCRPGARWPGDPDISTAHRMRFPASRPPAPGRITRSTGAFSGSSGPVSVARTAGIPARRLFRRSSGAAPSPATPGPTAPLSGTSVHALRPPRRVRR